MNNSKFIPPINRSKQVIYSIQDLGYEVTEVTFSFKDKPDMREVLRNPDKIRDVIKNDSGEEIANIIAMLNKNIKFIKGVKSKMENALFKAKENWLGDPYVEEKSYQDLLAELKDSIKAKEKILSQLQKKHAPHYQTTAKDKEFLRDDFNKNLHLQSSNLLSFLLERYNSIGVEQHRNPKVDRILGKKYTRTNEEFAKAINDKLDVLQKHKFNKKDIEQFKTLLKEDLNELSDLLKTKKKSLEQNNSNFSSNFFSTNRTNLKIKKIEKFLKELESNKVSSSTSALKTFVEELIKDDALTANRGLGIKKSDLQLQLEAFYDKKFSPAKMAIASLVEQQTNLETYGDNNSGNPSDPPPSYNKSIYPPVSGNPNDPLHSDTSNYPPVSGKPNDPPPPYASLFPKGSGGINPI